MILNSNMNILNYSYTETALTKLLTYIHKSLESATSFAIEGKHLYGLKDFP